MNILMRVNFFKHGRLSTTGWFMTTTTTHTRVFDRQRFFLIATGAKRQVRNTLPSHECERLWTKEDRWHVSPTSPWRQTRWKYLRHMYGYDAGSLIDLDSTHSDTSIAQKTSRREQELSRVAFMQEKQQPNESLKMNVY